jgi:NADPH-dependent curcumin reductase CurA
MKVTKSREIRLASRPKGWPTPENFEIAEVELPQPEAGEILVRNLYMSVDPYMRGRMNDVKSYIPPFELGRVMDGGAVGEVVESKDAELSPGDIVLSQMGWREMFVVPSGAVLKVDGGLRPLSAYLGVLGMPGLTAWAGLNLVDVKAGDRVLISAAAGAVGSTAGQLAKLRGCTVIGTAGSSEKVKMLVDELGFDAAVNYRGDGLVERLYKAAPKGVDVYFDNVGGAHLEAALELMRPHGRIIACGAISHYNDAEPTPGPRNLSMIIGKRLTVKGFIVMDWLPKMSEYLKEAGSYLKDGKLKMKETVTVGIEQAPRAFIDLLNGGNVGKMLVKLG